ncbi:unnamed protein product [Closterium sp. NIES-53]
MPFFTVFPVKAARAPPFVIAGLFCLPAFLKHAPLLLCRRRFRVLLSGVSLLCRRLQHLGRHGDFGVEGVDDELVVNQVVDVVKDFHLTLVPHVGKDEVVLAAIDGGGDPTRDERLLHELLWDCFPGLIDPAEHQLRWRLLQIA